MDSGTAMTSNASAQKLPWWHQGAPPRRFVVAIFVFLAALPVPLLTIENLISLHSQVIDDAQNKTDTLARVFASHAAQALGEFTRDLNNLARHLTDQTLLANEHEETLHRLLEDTMAASVREAYITNAQGMVIAGLRHYPQPMLDRSARVYFQFHRDNASSAIFFSPVFSGQSGRPVVAMSRRLAAADGSFIGLVSLVLSPDFFSDVYSHASLGDGGMVELLNDAGIILARSPGAPDVVGTRSGPMDGVRPTPGTIWRGGPPFQADGIPRVASLARVAEYPLFVQVGVSRTSALVRWREELFEDTIVAICVTLVLAILSFLLFRQYSRLAASEHSERQKTEILNATIASMADAVLVAKEDGTVALANPAARRLFGDVSSPDWSRKLPCFLGDGVTPLRERDRPIYRALRNETVDDVEFVVRPPDLHGSRHLVASGRPVEDATGAFKGAVVVYRDVTEARETERQLRDAQKMEAMGRLTGGIAHDFNNILTVVTGTIGILANAVGTKPEYATSIHLLGKAAARATELTRHLLAFARKQALRPCATDINTLTVDTMRLLQPSLGEKIDVHTIFDEHAWPALVDPSQLTTALLNLAFNARDAIASDGKLTIETSNVVLDASYAEANSDVRPGEYVMIAVSDTGSGILPELKEKIFEPFFTTKQPGHGTGLGLSMVYGFIKQSGGHISVRSEVGAGTTISLYLPRAPVAAPRPAEPQSNAVQCGTETILVVEDDALVRDYVNIQLTRLGYVTLVARNAEEAFALAMDGAKFDLLFTDVIMPGAMNGRELAEAMRKLRPACKVLYTSGYTEDAILQRGYLDRTALLLFKPYSERDLALMIRAALGRSEGPKSESKESVRAPQEADDLSVHA